MLQHCDTLAGWWTINVTALCHTGWVVDYQCYSTVTHWLGGGLSMLQHCDTLAGWWTINVAAL